MFADVVHNLTNLRIRGRANRCDDDIKGVVLLFQLLDIPLQLSLASVVSIEIVGTVCSVDSNTRGTRWRSTITLFTNGKKKTEL